MNNIQDSAISDTIRSGSQVQTNPVLSRVKTAEEAFHATQARWNDTEADFPQACTHELFQLQAERTPLAIAVAGKGRSLNYQELNEQANQVAHFLRKLGVGPGSLVGVCLERSPELVSALFGVWKSGGAYVPLDPGYPQERISFMVNDASITTVLTEQKHKHLFSAPGVRAVCMDSDWESIAQQSSANLESCTEPADLAYVMYTSGSTGKPKGAMILHRGLVNYLWWAIGQYKVRDGGSVPVHSSISFDLTVTSLYPALLTGGQVDLLDDDFGALHLVTALREKKHRNLVKITPAHLEALSQQMSRSEMADLTDLFVIGGESLLAENLRVWRESAPQTRLINEYGPTETVVGCCVYEVSPDDPQNGPVPIGRPIANMRMYILDENLLAQPPGSTGEIYIGGVGVARGYLDREELTRERFLKDPFSTDEQARMYKTGDLGRYRQDGVIEYLGRTDSQVKIRGYRMELGEIEATLASHPLVQSCAVLAREDEPGNRTLVGYVSPAKNGSLVAEDLRSFLEEKLPAYMVPAHFVLLEFFPLTPNGKVDRKALPAPSAQHASAEGDASGQPRNTTEERLAAIWMDLFKLDRIGINDDFFDLGGHSLLAIKAMSRIRETFGVQVPAETFFVNSTIAGLAENLMEAGASSAFAAGDYV